MQVPPSFHAVDLQAHAEAASLYAESASIHPIQAVALVHPEQLALQAIYHFFLITKNKLFNLNYI